MQLIAHRGASAYAPENTLAAFQAALKMGAKAVELDVHQTRDLRLVVVHDDDFKRVGGHPEKVADMNFSEVRKLDVGSWFDASFSAQRPPSLEEVFDLCGGKVEIHVEIKNGSRVYPGIEARVVSLIARRRAWKRACVSSFDHAALREARRLEGRLRIGYLLGSSSMPAALKEMVEIKAESLNLNARRVDLKKVKSCHEKGLRVLVYTVNTPEEARRLDKMGVDGVFSNYPDLPLPT